MASQGCVPAPGAMRLLQSDLCQAHSSGSTALNLAFRRSVSQLPHRLSYPSQLRPCPGPVRVTQAKDKDEGAKGTTIFRTRRRAADDGTQKLVRGRGGTKKLTFSPRPAEVPAAPAGLLEGLVQPFANLFRGRAPDTRTVFVAGATGPTGARIVLELLAAGFSVRAGVDVAQSRDSLEKLAGEYRAALSSEAAKRLSLVQFSTTDADFSAKAFDKASKVVVALGPDENGPKAKITPQIGLLLLEAAEGAKVPYFVLITSAAEAAAGSSPSGSTGSSSSGGGGGFFGAIFGFLAKVVQGGPTYGDLLEALTDSSIAFSVVRTAQTAGVPDTFAEQSNIVIVPEGKLVGGSISRPQVAAVVKELLTNTSPGLNKVFDVVASEEADAVPISEMLEAVPTDGRRAAKEATKAKAEAEAKEREFRVAAEAEAKAVAAEAKAAAEALAALEADAKRVAVEEAKAAAAEARAQARAQAATESVTELTKSLKAVGGAPLPPAEPAPKVALKSVLPSFASLVPNIPPPTPSSVAAAAQSAAARFRQVPESEPTGTTKQRRPLRQKESRPKPAPPEPKPVATPPRPAKKEKILGGVFGEQETVYMEPEAGDF